MAELSILHRDHQSPEEIGQRLLSQASTMARELGVEPKTALLRSGDNADEILAVVSEIEADLVVMGANL